MALPFLDTNVILRHLLADHPELSPKATEIIERLERNELEVQTSDTVIFEVVFTLDPSYRQTRDRIADSLLELIDLPGVVLPGKRDYRRAFALYTETGLGFADCYHVAFMERLGINEILSFDTDFDRVTGIVRREA